MFKKSVLGSAIAFAIAAPTLAMAEVETSVVLKNETAVFIKEGQRIGEAKSMLDTDGDGRKIGKFENSARVFFNGDVGEDSSWHGELKVIYDAAAEDGYKGHENYTQNDWLRELYVDTEAAGWDLRLGKQQVVWGTADGIKLLDIINPTDYREVVQNTIEDSRIPVWMINAERYVGDGNGNIQLIVSQAEENKIPGLNSDGDSGHGFIMKGVDTISGQVNGFYNIAPALSNVAATFQGAAMGGAFTGGTALNTGLNLFGGLTVDGFASGFWDATTTPGILAATVPTDPSAAPGYILLNGFAQNGFTGQPGFPAGVTDPNGNYNATNLMAVTGPTPPEVAWTPAANPSSAFEYMSNATFATFNTFTGFDSNKPTGLGGVQTQWKRDYADVGANFGGRFRNSLENGLNFSVNYFYHYSANPEINLSWHDATTGAALTSQLAPTLFFDTNSTPGPQADDTYIPDVATSLTRNQARSNWDLGNATSILVHDGTGSTYYGALDPSAVLASLGDGNPFNDPVTPGAGAPALRFTETSNRVHSIGASFDYAVDAQDLPIIIRGEFLYDKDEKQPVVDKFLLSLGDLTNALTMQDADYFKYVLGVDVTVLTNMLASFQFIQFRNLDFIDQSDSCTTQGGNAIDCSRYTADFATLHLSNGLQKGVENKEFYSFFLSKPFGDSDLGRWNNIIMYEEGGGYWDRLDAEYSISDQLVVTGEINMYWGDEDTQFGQFKNSSNVQVGLKYIIE